MGEKLGSDLIVINDVMEFQDCINYILVDNLPSAGVDYTRYNKREGNHRIYGKLDRLMLY